MRASPGMINYLGCLQDKCPCLISGQKYVFGAGFLKDLWNYFIEWIESIELEADAGKMLS